MEMQRSWWLIVSLICGCSSTTDPFVASDAAIDGAPSETIDAAIDAPETDAAAYCHDKVRIGLYADDTCTPGSELLEVELAIGKECSSWSRSTGSGTRENSATRFQCYRDRLCYTQYVGTATCDLGAASRREDKGSRLDTCLKDPTPNLWTRILGGTENCPEPPAGFQCPPSADDGGTDGLKAACSL